ncbi:MAG: CinA family protein [Actinomycetales bacterium]|nr:CinA family protein [Actinomycetales bacterium]
MVAPIARKALSDGVTLAVAESLTCGALVNALGAGEDSVEWLAGGVVAYQTSTKVDVLGMDPGVYPCSSECAVQLAVGVRELLRADVAVSTTGVGGPGADGEHPAGTVFIGWASDRGVGHRAFSFDGAPEEVLDQTVAMALRELLGLLEGA